MKWKLSILCLLLSIPCFGLNSEEISAVQKLNERGVATKIRTVEELNSPMKTMDVLSLGIKTISLSQAMDAELYLDVCNQFSDAFIGLYDWQSTTEERLSVAENELIENRKIISELKQSQANQHLINWGLFVIGLFGLLQ